MDGTKQNKFTTKSKRRVRYTVQLHLKRSFHYLCPCECVSVSLFIRMCVCVNVACVSFYRFLNDNCRFFLLAFAFSSDLFFSFIFSLFGECNSDARKHNVTTMCERCHFNYGSDCHCSNRLRANRIKDQIDDAHTHTHIN